jgi:hypothetical protein
MSFGGKSSAQNTGEILQDYLPCRLARQNLTRTFNCTPLRMEVKYSVETDFSHAPGETLRSQQCTILALLIPRVALRVSTTNLAS